MKVDRKTVEKVAGLARLDLTQKEAAGFSKDLTEVLSAFKTLQEIDTKGVKPTFQPVDQKNVLRDDAIERSIPRERLLRDIKNREEGYIRGPRVI